jgi:prephenate dehydrogenase
MTEPARIWRTMLAVTPTDTGPGVLARITTAFGATGTNMTSLIERPLKAQANQYLFVVTFDAAPWHPDVRVLLDALAGAGDSLKVLGAYRAQPGSLDGVVPAHMPAGSVTVGASGDEWASALLLPHEPTTAQLATVPTTVQLPTVQLATALTPHVAVLGLGLIGGSLARLLHARGVAVVGQDGDLPTVHAARDAGLTAVSSVAEAVAHADLVVLAVPLAAMRAVAKAVARHARPDATITDVGSVKAPVRAAMTSAGLADRYVGAHPMAGTEHTGFAASSVDLLDAAPWVVTRPGDPDRVLALLALLTGVLRARVLVLPEQVHDEAAALISHVPHVLATQLLNTVARADVREVALAMAAGSFRDGTRVAWADPSRTVAMVTDNADWVAPTLRTTAREDRKSTRLNSSHSTRSRMPSSA